MRDLLIVLIYVVALLYALRNPFVGILVFYWISFMNPHRYSWGFAYDLPLAMGAAVVTFVSVVFHIRELKFPATRETYLFILWWVFVSITTYFAFYPDEAYLSRSLAKFF